MIVVLLMMLPWPLSRWITQVPNTPERWRGPATQRGEAASRDRVTERLRCAFTKPSICRRLLAYPSNLNLDSKVASVCFIKQDIFGKTNKVLSYVFRYVTGSSVCCEPLLW